MCNNKKEQILKNKNFITTSKIFTVLFNSFNMFESNTVGIFSR